MASGLCTVNMLQGACGCCSDPIERGRCKTQFTLWHEHPVLFVTAQWKWISLPLFWIWRLLAVVYFFTWIGISGHSSTVLGPQHMGKWLIHLTDWMFLMQAFAALAHLVAVSVALYRKRKGECIAPGMSVLLKVVWLLYNVSTNGGVSVTVLYWSMLYSGEEPPTAVAINTHGINSLYILMDMCITAIPIRIQHFYHGQIFGMAYVVFSIAYTLAGGTDENDNNYIYSILKWRTEPIAASTTAAVNLGTLVCLWLMLCALNWLRRFIAAGSVAGMRSTAHGSPGSVAGMGSTAHCSPDNSKEELPLK